MNVLIAFLGLSEGFIVGGALVAFIVILDIISRLVQVTCTEEKVKIYEVTFVIAVTLSALAYALNINFHINKIFSCFIGLIMGVFIGMLSSALTEVTNVIPIIVDRFSLRKYTKIVLISLLCGKTAGSLFYWIFLNK